LGVGEVERRRLAALTESGLLAAGGEEAFDRLTRLAARLCEAPIARVSLVAGARQVFKSAVGALPPTGRQTPLSHALCKYVAYDGAELVVVDAVEDPRVADSGAVREHGVRAYAGEPLFSAEGECLGALCVVDEHARDWSEQQLAALRDLAAAANTEIRLRASAARLAEQARLLELTPDAVIARRASDDVVTFWNPAAERMYGLSAEHAVGRTPGELFGACRADLDAVREALERDGRWEGERTSHTGGRGSLVVYSRQTLERDADGTPWRILQTDSDATERRRLQERVRQAEKMEALGQLAGGVAHDFNNLLTAISGYCALARDTTPGPSEELEQIARAAERAGELTGKLLAFSRRQELRLSELDLGEVAGELVPLLRRLIGEHIKIALKHDGGPARVLADRAQLEQVIINLAVNARDAMPTGGTLTIETHCHHGSGRFARADDTTQRRATVELVVSDTGVGIAPEIAERVFEPFFTTKPAGYGTGLGLATVHGIVTQSDGEVRIESQLGTGTSVAVTLPAATVPRSRDATRTGTLGELRGDETVLVCEDEPAVLALLERLLVRHGYTVISAGHPARALEHAHAHAGRIDAVVADIVMPDMLGTELAARLTVERPQLRVLLISGYTAEALGDAADLPAGSAFLEKPFRNRELLAGLRSVLDQPLPRATDAPGSSA
jgi:PAS domain S-box-containing protein